MAQEIAVDEDDVPLAAARIGVLDHEPVFVGRQVMKEIESYAYRGIDAFHPPYQFAVT